MHKKVQRFTSFNRYHVNLRFSIPLNVTSSIGRCKKTNFIINKFHLCQPDGLCIMTYIVVLSTCFSLFDSAFCNYIFSLSLLASLSNSHGSGKTCSFTKKVLFLFQKNIYFFRVNLTPS